MDGDVERTSARRGHGLIIALSAVAVVLALAVTKVLVAHFYGEPANAAEFGDLFGFANALFAGLAFTALIYAVLLQSRELALQRHELSASREQLALQRAELAATREEMERSRAEAARTADALELTVQVSAVTQLVSIKGAQLSAARDRVAEMTRAMSQGVRSGWNDAAAQAKTRDEMRHAELDVARLNGELAKLYERASRESG